MTKFNWKVTDMYTLNEGALTDYVVTALYNVTGIKTVEGTEYTASLSNLIKFKVINDSTFIPYSDLTNTIVVGWIKSNLGENGINSMQSSVEGMINSKINPPISPQNTELPLNFNIK